MGVSWAVHGIDMLGRQHAGMAEQTTLPWTSALQAPPGTAPFPRKPPALPPLETAWARSESELRAAQALRWRVFAEEMGAQLQPPPGTPAGHDADELDRHCEHLLVKTVPGDGQAAQVVGTYRVLTPAAARRAGRLYSDGEFDLRALATLRPWMAELGRSCVDPAFRGGGAVLLMWSELAAFMQRNHVRWVLGCVSIPMRDGGHMAASLWRKLADTHKAGTAFAVTPRCALPVDSLRQDLDVEPPPLLKGYLRAGAKLLGPPAWDADFNTADLPMMLSLNELPASYKRRFSR
jgi:putative hemolysin